jgi:hypothetical protein
MTALWLILFAITAGFTVSAIVANLYRLSGAQAKDSPGRTIRLMVMVVAGPSVIFENAMRGLLAKQWPLTAFLLTALGVAYWSLVIGLVVVSIALALQT